MKNFIVEFQMPNDNVIASQRVYADDPIEAAKFVLNSRGRVEIISVLNQDDDTERLEKLNALTACQVSQVPAATAQIKEFKRPVENRIALKDLPSEIGKPLPVGTIIDAPSSHEFMPIKFEVIGHEGNLNILQTVNVLTRITGEPLELAFDKDGCQRWPDCSLRKWLNNEFLAGFLNDEHGNAKTGADLDEAKAFVAMIKTHRTRGLISKSESYYVDDKVWLPSFIELGGGNSDYIFGKDGEVFEKFKDFATYDGIYPRIKCTNRGYTHLYWTRSAYSTYSTYSTLVWFVSQDGSFSYDGADNVYLGVSPLIAI